MMHDRMNALKASPSMEVTRRAKEMRERGEDVVALSIGDTHFAPTKNIRERFNQALDLGHSHYTQARGSAAFRKAAATYLNSGFAPEQILATPGVKQGLFYVMACLPVTEFAVVEPAWLGYSALCHLTGKKYSSVDRHDPNWREKLERNPPEALIICSPNNPDGYVYQAEEIERLAKVSQKHGMWLLLDEVYREYFFESKSRTQNTSKLYELPRVVVFNGLSKSHACTGLRLGYFASHDLSLLDSVLRMQQNIATCPSTPAMYAGEAFLDDLDEVRSFKQYYESNRQLVLEIFPDWQPFSPSGAFYFFIPLRCISNGTSLWDCGEILTQSGVALVPGEAYGERYSGFLRLSISTTVERLRLGLERLSLLR